MDYNAVLAVMRDQYNELNDERLDAIDSGDMEVAEVLTDEMAALELKIRQVELQAEK